METANPRQQERSWIERKRAEFVIELFDSLEPGPALDAAPLATVPLVIPEMIVDILDVEEIRPDMEVEVLSGKIVVQEQGARPLTRRPTSDEEVSSCYCPREGGPNNQETPSGSRPSKRPRHG